MRALDNLASNNNRPLLIPANGKTERKLLSVFMAILEIVPEFRGKILKLCDYPSGKTCKYESHMEPQYDSPSLYLNKKSQETKKLRPDGLIICQRGSKHWSAFIEAKSDINKIRSEQVLDYADLASKLDIDAIISISNEFALNPKELPYHLAGNKRRKREIFHLSWSEIRTCLGMFLGSSNSCNDAEKQVLHHALSFMLDDKSGVKTYDMMPEGWAKFVESASTELGFSTNTQGVMDIIHGWQQERRDLCAKLNGIISEGVELRHPSGARSTPKECIDYDKKLLANEYKLKAGYYFKLSKTHFTITSDLNACRNRFALKIGPPKGKKAKATITWICEKLSKLDADRYSIRLSWTGRSGDSTIKLGDLINQPEVGYLNQKETPKSISIITRDRNVRRFKSRKQFIEDLEKNAIQLIKDIRTTNILSE